MAVQELDRSDLAVETDDQASYDLARMRHSAAHLMAEAVQELFPDVKFAIGPAIENGFYYDMDLPRPLSTDDLAAIEEHMRAHQAAAEPFVRTEVSRDEALRIFKDNPYKIEIISELPEGGTISTYQQGQFLDLCRGPHVASTADIGPFKLQNVAGAYWRGDEHRPMLQRIYGTAWPTQTELDEYLARLEEAQAARSSPAGQGPRPLLVSEEIGPGLILWHPKGAMSATDRAVRAARSSSRAATSWSIRPTSRPSRSTRRRATSKPTRRTCTRRCQIEEVDYYLKPMNCPGHIMIYKSQVRSLSRPADPARRAGHGLPLRTLGHAARHAARARLHAGRRPHLLRRPSR